MFGHIVHFIAAFSKIYKFVYGSDKSNFKIIPENSHLECHLLYHTKGKNSFDNIQDFCRINS